MDNQMLMEKKIEYMIDMKVNKLKNEFKEAVEKVSQLTQEVDILKNKVQRLNLGVSPQTKLTTEEPEETKSDQANSRTGNLTPGEVSVEKFFYFGNK